MRIMRKSEYDRLRREAQLNPERDLTRVELTSFRRIAENMVKLNATLNKIASTLGAVNKTNSALGKIASEVSSVNSSLKQIATAVKSKS